MKEVAHPWEYGIVELDGNNAYVERGAMEYEIIEGWWLDAGENHEALLHANLMIARQAGIDI